MGKTRKLIFAGGLASVLIALAGAAYLSRHPIGNRAVPQPAKPVDLQRYLGRWYEIARYEQDKRPICLRSGLMIKPG